MTKPRLQRKTGGLAPGGNGSPWSDDDLRELLRKETAMASFNARRLDEVPPDLMFFVGGMSDFAPGEPRIVSWGRFFELTLAIEKSRPPGNWDSFPRTSADVRRIIRWRQANPAA